MSSCVPQEVSVQIVSTPVCVRTMGHVTQSVAAAVVCQVSMDRVVNSVSQNMLKIQYF